jgi:hypothetical protein
MPFPVPVRITIVEPFVGAVHERPWQGQITVGAPQDERGIARHIDMLQGSHEQGRRFPWPPRAAKKGFPLGEHEERGLFGQRKFFEIRIDAQGSLQQRGETTQWKGAWCHSVATPVPSVVLGSTQASQIVPEAARLPAHSPR